MKDQHQLNLAYESWEPLLRSKIEQLEYFLDSVKQDLSAIGMSRESSTVFLNGKIEEMRRQIAGDKVKTNKNRRKVG